MRETIMNNQRRKEISEVVKSLVYLKEKIERITDDELDYYDNMPENLHGSMRGMDSEEAIDSLNEAMEAIDEAIGNLDSIN